MTEDLLLTNDGAEVVWSSKFGNFLGPEHWAGSSSLRTYILSSIVNRSTAKESSEDRAFCQFIETLDNAFRLSHDMIETDRFEDLIRLTSSIAIDELFDPDHAEWSDKPYFRCQISVVACNLFISYYKARRAYKPAEWLDSVVFFLEIMTRCQQVNPKTSAYFAHNIEASSAQNYNLAAGLHMGVEWFSYWKPVTIASLSAIPESVAQQLCSKLRRRATEMARFLEQ